MPESSPSTVLKARLYLSLLAFLGVAATPPPMAHHKIQLNDPAMERLLMAQGARLIADYGAFRLYDSPTVPPSAENRDAYNQILLNSAPFDSSTSEAQGRRRAVGNFQGRKLHLVQFAGPVRPEWRRALEQAGARVVNYIPHNACLIYGDASALARIQAFAARPFIQWDGEYSDDVKIQSGAAVQAKATPADARDFAVQLVFDPEANSATLALLRQLANGASIRQHHVLDFVNVIVPLVPANLARVAAQPDVIAIHPWHAPKKLDERQDQIVAGNISGGAPAVPSAPGYLDWLASKGFTQDQFDASGFVVDISDSGIDNGTTFPNHFGLYEGGSFSSASRVMYNRLEGTPNPPDSTIAGCDGHGTLDAHVVGGFDNFSNFPFADAAGFHYGLGVCPFVRLGSSVVFDPENWTSPHYSTLQSQAYLEGARISNNSWGDDVDRGGYDEESQELDALVRDAQPASAAYPAPGNQEMVLVFAAGNTDQFGILIDQPGGTAKNVICVGAADNVQPYNEGDDAEAHDANQIFSFSDHGPCRDGRMKPDLVAPGSHISGGAPESASPGQDGAADPCFFTYANSYGYGVTGTPDGPFFPTGQQFYDVSDGTSHSAPAVAGGCALLRQYFINQGWSAPSPAMSKAFLMNCARYLTGSTANDTLWSPVQGMGEMDLGAAFDGAPRVLRDELADDLFTASGQTRSFNVTVSDPTQPFLVTVAWTDAPGSTTGAAYNNDLDLTVNVAGQLYKGNVFQGRWSVPGGSADLVNNVESVFLPPGTTGPVTIAVTAANINSIGVPNTNNFLEQDFALVIDNALGAGPPLILPAGAAILSQNCQPGTPSLEPGAVATIAFSLRNAGLVNTTNLVATLLPAGGVVSPTPPQTYGALSPEGRAVSQSFSFTAAGACGSNVTATLQLSDGAENLGQVRFAFPLCQPNAVLTQNFDSLAAPLLPSSWTTEASGGQGLWATQTNIFESAPNAVFSAASTNIGVADLLSPPVAIQTASAQLSFWHEYDLELDPTNSALAYDGGVLEISVAGSNFVDILAAGGTFLTNGYNTAIASSSVDDNPLPGRRSWSGLAPNFLHSVVRLPAAAAGQVVQFKWRCATDQGNDFGSVGWWIDNIEIDDGFQSVCCGCPSPPLLLNPRVADGNFVFSFQSVSNQTYRAEYADSLAAGSGWTALPSISGNGGLLSVTNALAPGPRFYRIVSP